MYPIIVTFSLWNVYANVTTIMGWKFNNYYGMFPKHLIIFFTFSWLILMLFLSCHKIDKHYKASSPRKLFWWIIFKQVLTIWFLFVWFWSWLVLLLHISQWPYHFFKTFFDSQNNYLTFVPGEYFCFLKNNINQNRKKKYF